tara:strand:- start:19 stop:483 length:465 start_codon:yes stop_codon:yes gene_type:complete
LVTSVIPVNSSVVVEVGDAGGAPPKIKPVEFPELLVAPPPALLAVATLALAAQLLPSYKIVVFIFEGGPLPVCPAAYKAAVWVPPPIPDSLAEGIFVPAVQLDPLYSKVLGVTGPVELPPPIINAEVSPAPAPHIPALIEGTAVSAAHAVPLYD